MCSGRFSQMRGAASSDDPISLLARAISIAPVTTEAKCADRLPGFRQRFVAPRRRDRRKLLEMDGAVRGVARRPRFFRGEDENRREPDRHGAKNLLDRLQRAAPPRARRRIAIKRVLADVEIERRQVGVHERRQRRDHAGVIETGVGLAHPDVELGELVQHQPVEVAQSNRAGSGRPARDARACRASSGWCCAACGNCRRRLFRISGPMRWSSE